MKKGTAPFFFVALIVFAADQFTKYAVEKGLDRFGSVGITSFFNLVYVENTGSAFGLFRNLGNLFFIAVASAAVVIISILILRDRDNRTAFALILGGAAGNLADRISRGYVVDFLDFHIAGHHWPAFNIADSALTAGIALLLISAIFPRRAS